MNKTVTILGCINGMKIEQIYDMICRARMVQDWNIITADEWIIIISMI